MSDKQIHDLVRRLGASEADILELDTLLGGLVVPAAGDTGSSTVAISMLPHFSIASHQPAGAPGTVTRW